MIIIKFNNKENTIYKSAIVLFAVSFSILSMPLIEGSDAERVFVSLLLTSICLVEIYSDVKLKFFYRIQLFFGGFSILFAWLAKIETDSNVFLLIEYIFFSF